MKFVIHKIWQYKKWWGRGIAVLTILLLLIASNQQLPQRQCRQVKIDIKDNNELGFVTSTDVKDIIDYHYTEELTGQPLKQINLKILEEAIKKNPYIRDVMTYIDIQANLHIVVEQRQPVVRVINKPYVDYYIDEKGFRMPLSNKFTARVMVANGYVSDPDYEADTIKSESVEKLWKVAKYIHTKPYWQAQVEQIYVNAESEFVLIPRVGSHEVILGKARKLKQKFRKLKAFYNESLHSIGWNHYKQINLKFENQVVAQKF